MQETLRMVELMYQDPEIIADIRSRLLLVSVPSIQGQKCMSL